MADEETVAPENEELLPREGSTVDEEAVESEAEESSDDEATADDEDEGDVA